MIYLDSSIALAAVLAEPRAPPAAFWKEPLISSRLLEFETMNRIHARGLGDVGVSTARKLLDVMPLVELTPAILARALAPFPIPVRTLDSLHLATIDYLRGEGQSITLATYDNRLAAAAQALGIPLAPV